MNIWVLSHQYDYGNLCDKYKWNEEGRILGVYYTREVALRSLTEYQKIKGFSSHISNFYIEEYILDEIKN
ncbi:hypothetical protein AB8B22_05380 [Leptotrichia sp. HSP-334]|uniref:DUF7336 domain-containing protein n=1 Tax=Leptotrichia rugosa TaxID=3239302 RepID=A0AB39VDE5_9FUSO|nr:hypothetical protein [Leptotrichia sp. oral taxon 498]ASQ49037.1 hypothetical protein BCB68_08945 [Leptotrichia sp. oral taxon 498]